MSGAGDSIAGFIVGFAAGRNRVRAAWARRRRGYDTDRSAC